MNDFEGDEFKAFVFKNRGALLALPAIGLILFGRPSAFSISLGLPLAFLGEAVRCWAVGYSGVTTRDDRVVAPELVTAGPYAYVRNPLYVGNFLTAAGFALAYTGKNTFGARLGLMGLGLGSMAAIYAIIIPHEEAFLRSRFGAAFEAYCGEVPPIFPLKEAAAGGKGDYKPEVIPQAESRTFGSLAAMLVILGLKALRA
ncbi:MAG: hypothetical protein DLM50_08730 [Candidatus Meridianibacter frigidus]|nr:MAG: hypothetical protein DLM50_08730 [Candidatus Eremiobacteraeota bacterium]